MRRRVRTPDGYLPGLAVPAWDELRRGPSQASRDRYWRGFHQHEIPADPALGSAGIGEAACRRVVPSAGIDRDDAMFED